MRQLIILLFTLFLLSSCKESDSTSIIQSLDIRDFIAFNPSVSNLYRIDSIIVFGTSGSVMHDTTQWFMKESIEEIDTLSDESIVIYYKRSLSAREEGPFAFAMRYSIRYNRDEMIKNESGVNILLMNNPLLNSREFNPVKYLDPTEQFPIAGERVQVFKNWSSAVITFSQNSVDSTNTELNIAYVDTENLIEERRVSAVYQKGLGLKSSYKEIFDSQCITTTMNCEELSWIAKADKGFIERINWIRRL